MVISEELETVLENARWEAARTGHRMILPKHLLLAVTRRPDCSAARAILSCGASLEDLKAEAEAGIFRDEAVPFGEVDLISLSEDSLRILSSAVRKAAEERHSELGSIHLLMAMADKDGGECRRILAGSGVTPESALPFLPGVEEKDGGKEVPDAAEIAAAIAESLMSRFTELASGEGGIFS